MSKMRTRIRGVTNAATKPAIRPAMINRAGFNIRWSNQGGRHRGDTLWLLVPRRRGLSAALAVAMVLLAAVEEIENPMGVTMHEDVREPLERIERGILPQDFPRNRQRRVAHARMQTGGVSEPVACLCDTRHDGRIEASVRIS